MATTTADTAETTPEPLLSAKDLCQLLNVRRTRTILDMAQKGTIPQPKRINARVYRWTQSSIAAFLAGTTTT